MLSDEEIFELVQPLLPGKGHAYIWATDPEYAKAVGIDVGTRWIINEMHPEHTLAVSRAIESAATAPLLARIAEMERLTRELEEARKDAERLTNEQIDAGIKAWFSTDITINEGKDRGHPFRQRMRAAIRAAIKEQT